MKSIITSLLLLITLSACASKQTVHIPADKAVSNASIKCSVPRPQVCTREYRPVCARVDTGIRCVTTPCPSFKKKTYANACTACADDKVLDYREGPCEISK